MENELFKTLQKITGRLLFTGAGYLEMRDACLELFRFYNETAGFNPDEEANQHHLATPAGLAVSPCAAAYCVPDFMRTCIFLRGIKAAIDVKLKACPQRPVRILYAGTGPFATLVTPLLTLYTPAQAELVLMDINPLSLQYLQQIIRKLKLEPWIKDLVEADASTYKIPAEYQPDILVSETMKPGLEKEPQVSIVANLMAQCGKDTILVPENIKISLYLAGNRAANTDAVMKVQTLFELNAESARDIQLNKNKIPLLTEGIRVRIDNSIPSHLTCLTTATEITVFDHYRIELFQSSLTLLRDLLRVSEIKSFPAEGLIRYEIKETPGFRLSIL